MARILVVLGIKEVPPGGLGGKIHTFWDFTVTVVRDQGPYRSKSDGNKRFWQEPKPCQKRTDLAGLGTP